MKESNRSNKRQEFNDKENRNSVSLNERSHNSTQVFNVTQQPNQVLQQVFLMLAEIKNQNQYLIDRNSELEAVINQELKPMIRNGLNDIRTEFRDFKKKNKVRDFQNDKRYRFMQSRAQRKFQSTQKLYTVNQTEQSQEEEVEQQQKIQEQNIITQNDINAESTFMRKLEDTVQDPRPITDDMRFSLGANLLQMMQMNTQNQTKKNKVRNFNFRCNLKEIDKIIEEELNEGNAGGDQSNYDLSMNASPMNKLQFDQTIEQQQRDIEEAEAREFNENMEILTNSDQKENNTTATIMKVQRPGTGMRVEGQKQQRKMWGVNARQIQGRPKTGAVQKANKNQLPRLSIDDPILALLKQQSQEPKIESNTQSTDNQYIDLQDKSQEISLAEKIQDLKISDLQTNSNHNSNSSPQQPILEETKSQPVVSQNNIIQNTNNVPQRRGNLPVRRGMFKAPPTNLIESLLMEDSNTEEIQNIQHLGEVPQPKKVITPIRINKNIIMNPKVNNFVSGNPRVSQSRSRSRAGRNSTNAHPKSTSNLKTKKIVTKKFGPINFCDNDSDDEQEGDENPFQCTKGMINFVGNQQNNQDSAKFTETEKQGAFFFEQVKNKKSSNDTNSDSNDI